MSVESIYIDGVQDYLEDACELNKLVGHNKPTDVAPDGQRTFARFESEEHIRAIVNCAGKNIVVVADCFGQRTGEVDDQSLVYTLQLLFASKKETGTGNETAAINDAIKTAEKIMFQFWTKMEKDFQEGCNALEDLQPERVTWNPIQDQPWLDDYYGWILSIPFGTYMPEYNDADWDSAETSIVIDDQDTAIRTFKLFARFEVGATGALLNEGDTLIIHNKLADRNVLCLADGKPLPVDDMTGNVDWTGSIDRRVKHLKSSNELEFIGSVKTAEIIEIYIYT
ncbi:MAG: hypothetical protein IAE96_04870 [Chitinophagaceae bacterium]|nr:hypothetical protein [Chitinophagaceae bacterium]